MAEHEPGWYHADGDPPGTVRRWNGEMWIGFPIERPGHETKISSTEPFTIQKGTISIRWIAVLAQIMFAALAVFSAMVAFALYRLADDVGGIDLPDDVGISNLGDSWAATLAIGLTGTLIFRVIASLCFLLWFYLAYRNMSHWHKVRREPFWAVAAWFVPIMNLVRPLSMTFELYEHSPRRLAKAPNPVPVFVWWVLTVGGSFGILLVGSDVDALTKTGINALALASAGATAAAILAIFIIQAVTDAQQSRRKPTKAQKQAMLEAAQKKAMRDALLDPGIRGSS